MPKISRDDEVEVIRGPVQVLHVGPDGLKSRRCHGGTHVIGVFNAQIRDGADSTTLDPRSGTGGADKRRTGTGDGPLGSGSSLTAVPQRKPILSF